MEGVRLLGRGLALYVRTPRLLALGLVPAVAAAVVFTAVFAVLVYFLGDLATAATWFAADWPETSRAVARALAGIGIFTAAAFLGVLSFTAVTLAIGDPFYEVISRRVDQAHGGVPGEVETGFWRGLRRSVGESARLMVLGVACGVPLFVAGFLPLVGQTVVPAVGATVGGWLLALQLTGVPFARRGMWLDQRRRVLWANRATVLGFGTAAFVCFLVPGGAVLLMPAAVAGATLLTRHLHTDHSR